MNIEILIYSTWWDKPPQIQVGFDDQMYFQNSVKNSKDDPLVIKFKVEDSKLAHSSNIWVELCDKDSEQTVINNDQIVQDQLLHIEKILINGIDLGALKHCAIYRPTYPEPWFQQQQDAGTAPPETMTETDTLGFNGRWTLTFTNPFHIWYLENLP